MTAVESPLHTSRASQSPETSQPRPARPARKAKPRRPVRRFFIVSHRWLSLVLGVVLVVITTSGALLVWAPEITRASYPAAYAASGDAPTIDLASAVSIVGTAHPDFAPLAVVNAHGVFTVTDYETGYTVDPAGGALLGEVDGQPEWLGLLANLHECMLSCETLAGYVPALADPVPGTGWLGYDGETDVTWSSLILIVMGVLLLYLCLTGLWLWFPRPRRWREGVQLRWSKGRFARDTDLHKLAGMIVLVPLAMWGLTGMGFESRLAEDAWYAALPGSPIEDPLIVDAGTAAADSPIGIAAAVTDAQRAVPDASIATVSLPDPADATAPYDIWLGSGLDPYGQSDYPGNVEVTVDQYTGATAIATGRPDESAAQVIWSMWNYPVHSGYVVDGWWRTLWFVAGISPILLAVTGVSTWLVRRRSAANRKRRQRTVAAA